jgi:hypothetical protein
MVKMSRGNGGRQAVSDERAMRTLERLTELGFTFRQLPRYERQVAAERGGFVALLEYTAGGEIRQFSSAGLLLEGQVAVLVYRGEAAVFQAKQVEAPATAEMLESYRVFQQDLSAAMKQSGDEAR